MNFIVARLSGGLGNQLFQYAAACGIAESAECGIALDVSGFGAANERRSFALGRFELGAPLLSGATFDPQFTTASIPVSGDDTLVAPVRRENTYEFEPETKALRGPAYLYGFWQSWRYFDGIRDTLRRRLKIAPPPVNDETDASVAVHLRRGDYLREAAHQSFGPCAPAYYAAAMEFLRARVRGARFFIFSDDPHWCSSHFAERDITIVSRPRGDAVDDLARMAGCRHHIIANSSMSWWGAWLGEQVDSIVIAPIPWYNQSPQARDLIPDRWIRLNRTTGAPWSEEQRRVGGAISVVVLRRGRADQAREAAACARAQTFPPQEILIESGPSVAAALNAGINKARGDWIAFLDAGDAWLPDKLRIELETAYLTGADAVDCRTIPTAGPHGPPALYPPPGPPDCDLAALLRAGHFIAGISHTMARRRVLATMTPFADDWTPETPGAAWAAFLARPSTVMLWQRLVKSPIPWLACPR
jgi:hypothetical protein